MKTKFFKVNTLPTACEPDAVYFELNGNYAESYVTDSSGVAKLIGNSTMITNVANSLMSNEVLFAADVPARDALTLTQNSLVFVNDASGDTTVNSGSALYFWDNTGGNFIKVTEFESMDLVINWADIQNKPTSTVTQIDQAVTNSHTHANKAQLDKIGEDAEGDITYNGNPVLKWDTINW